MDSGQENSSGYSGDTGTGGVVTEQVKQTTQQAVQQTQQAAGQVAEGAKNQATSYAEGQKQTATNSLRTVADALHQTSTNLEQKSPGPIVNYTRTAGDRVEAFAQYLESTPVQDLVNDVEDLARRNSTLFLGGAFALGLAAARFIKASAQNSGSSQRKSSNYGYGSLSSGYAGSLPDSSSYGTQARSSSSAYGGSSYASGTTAGSGPSDTVVADEVEYPDATVFDAEGETTHGSSR